MMKSLLCLIGLIFGCSAVQPPVIEPVKAPDSEVDVLLIKYSKDMDAAHRLSDKHLHGDIKRTVIYPDCVVPVLIPPEKLEEVRKLVGEHRMIEISPKLK